MSDEETSETAAEEVEDQRASYVHPEGARDFRVEGNDVRDYIGVDPEYMTYANSTEGPILTDTERFLYTSQYDHLEGNADEEVAEDDESEPDNKTGAAEDPTDPLFTPLP